MATTEQHVKQITGEMAAALMVQLAIARARVDELEQELKARDTEPAKEPA